MAIHPMFLARPDERTVARGAGRNIILPRSMRAEGAPNIKSCKTNPFPPQFAKWSGALRFCATRRAARAEAKIARMQNFFRSPFDGLQVGAPAWRLRK